MSLSTNVAHSVQCICGEAICYDWLPDELDSVDLVTYAPRIQNGRLVLHPVSYCPRCCRRLTYQWLDRAIEQAEQAVA